MKIICQAMLISLISISLLGCASKNDNSTLDQNEYNRVKQILLKNDYQGTKNYNLQLAQSEQLYTITISNPAPKMRNLQVMALPIGGVAGDMLPNFNILEKQDLTSFYQYDKKIRINYFSKKAIKTFKVLLQYQIDNDKHQDIVKLTLPYHR